MTTTIKTCFKCSEEKPVSEFYSHPAMGDGYLGKCKECTKSDAKSVRDKRIDYYREYDRKRGSRQTAEDQRRYREANPKKRAAHVAIGNAVRDGKLAKQNCEVCGSSQVHAHHDDYSKPFDVRWLCPVHHFQWHAKHGEARNAA